MVNIPQNQTKIVLIFIWMIIIIIHWFISIVLILIIMEFFSFH